jgi:hypothetical protein
VLSSDQPVPPNVSSAVSRQYSGRIDATVKTSRLLSLCRRAVMSTSGLMPIVRLPLPLDP